MCDLIAFVLEISKSRMPASTVEQRFAQLRQRLAYQFALALEERVETALVRNQAQLHELTTRLKRKAAFESRSQWLPAGYAGTPRVGGRRRPDLVDHHHCAGATSARRRGVDRRQ